MPSSPDIFRRHSRLRSRRKRLRASRRPTPNALVCVDPILGDAGKLYVAEETAEAIRDQLLPLASIATPNLFELQWLSGASVTDAR